MGKVKYQGGITKLITTLTGKRNKKKFVEFINNNLESVIKQMSANLIDISLVSFSSNKDFYDQILSILSFLRYVGVPANWIIYSDGSHTSEQINLLTTGFEFVKVELPDVSNKDIVKLNTKESLLPFIEYLLDYAEKFPLGKKLYFYLNHSIEKPTLFLDSDILFYKNAPIINILLREEVNGWYIPDYEWSCLDSRYKAYNSEQLYQVNTGFFILKKELENIVKGLDFLKSLNFQYEYFSEQTTFHILFRDNSFMPLDPRRFVLNSGDQFNFSYLFSREKMAIRHYTGPVRHKMWQRDWKWHLSL